MQYRQATYNVGPHNHSNFHHYGFKNVALWLPK